MPKLYNIKSKLASVLLEKRKYIECANVKTQWRNLPVEQAMWNKWIRLNAKHCSQIIVVDIDEEQYNRDRIQLILNILPPQYMICYPNNEKNSIQIGYVLKEPIFRNNFFEWAKFQWVKNFLYLLYGADKNNRNVKGKNPFSELAWEIHWFNDRDFYNLNELMPHSIAIQFEENKKEINYSYGNNSIELSLSPPMCLDMTNENVKDTFNKILSFCYSEYLIENKEKIIEAAVYYTEKEYEKIIKERGKNTGYVFNPNSVNCRFFNKIRYLAYDWTKEFKESCKNINEFSERMFYFLQGQTTSEDTGYGHLTESEILATMVSVIKFCWNKYTGDGKYARINKLKKEKVMRNIEYLKINYPDIGKRRFERKEKEKIAEELKISVKTVEVYFCQIRKETGKNITDERIAKILEFRNKALKWEDIAKLLDLKKDTVKKIFYRWKEKQEM